MSQTLDAAGNFHDGAGRRQGSPTRSCSARPAGPDSRCSTNRPP